MEEKNEIKKTSFQWKGAKIIPLFIVFGLCFMLLMLPIPEGLNKNAWQLFSIFITTIVGLILQPLPIGATALLGLVACLFLKVITIQGALSGFSSQVVWLIAMAFMLARGFLKTGLGARIAYHFVSLFGKSTLGLAYSLTFTELILSPAMPSNTARGAGIIFPIITSLSKEYGSTPEAGTQRKIGSYLIKLLYQVNVVTSGMFMTATAANPLISSLAAKAGVNDLTWTKWAIACSVPGIINLILLPLVVFILHKPEMVKTPDAPKFAVKRLKELGNIKVEEIIMFCVFLLLLVMWVLGDFLNINATSAAILGLVILVITGVLTWSDVTNESGAWDTFIWMAILIMMCEQLEKVGMMGWLGKKIEVLVKGYNWTVTLILVACIYYYTHYFFASMTAHVTSLFSILLVTAISAGAPKFISAMLLGVISSLCAGITNYGTGSAPVFFNSKYLSIKQWWGVGFFVSLFNLFIWLVVGGLWWRFLGYF